MAEFMARIADAVWSYPVVGLCLLSALWFTISLRFIQLRALPHAIALLRGRFDRDDEAGSISHFQALSAALSGTIGIGNIAGVAIAIAVGGPGAVLWMWVTGLLGMATKFVECTLGTWYREVEPETGQTRGGPMFYIVAGLGPRWRPMALFYALTIAFAGFGFTCMFQSNQAAAALLTHFAIPTFATGAALALLTGAVVIGGIQSIGRWASRIVPTMVLVYVGGAVFICLWHIDALPQVVGIIVRDGFSGDAATGGVLGTMIMWGVRRAIFSNEAGLGSASIAHAAVKTDEPVREGVVASLGPLIDTVIVSGATAFVIVLAGNYGANKDDPVAHLDAIEVAGSWSQTPADVSGPALFDEQPELLVGFAVDGIEPSPAPIAFEIPPSALEHDGVRLAARVGSGRIRATLERGHDVLASHEFQARATPAWATKTLSFD
ncbi:MAG: amino acid carrier protein, partial [Deltaproteobacteria bacterium]|nr:amino acid carrier protein [Deltaproteobacteria bacterium]